MKRPKVYDYKRSWNYVLWLLSRKAYTAAQLKEKLEKKEAQPEVVARVLERLQELRFVDDAAYAQMYIRSRQRKKGRIALKRELMHKGVAKETVETALEPLDLETQIKTAAAVLEKQAWRFQNDERRKRYAKAYAFLARRGFTSEVVKGALERSVLFEMSD